MLDVTVERSKWYRGKDFLGSRLLRNDRQMCCLGFAALAAGCTKDEILDVAIPREGNAVGPRLPKLMQNYNILKLMVETNDYAGTNNSDREATLMKLGKLVDINFSFVD